MNEVIHSPLGKKSAYIDQYQADLLFSIPRADKRLAMCIAEDLPFHGVDIWNAYEISYLNEKGKPQVAIAEIIIPCTSPNIVESKSLKLYFNSFNQSKFPSRQAVSDCIEQDLSKALASKIELKLFTIDEYPKQAFSTFTGINLDKQDIEIQDHEFTSSTLTCDSGNPVTEQLYSNLLKSNCLVTGQPDWASIAIHYHGPKINHEGLLKYLLSFRKHNEFHEQCVERIFQDLATHCQCKDLSIYARYTRRGGIDINPYRSNFEPTPKNLRHIRQ